MVVFIPFVLPRMLFNLIMSDSSTQSDEFSPLSVLALFSLVSWELAFPLVMLLFLKVLSLLVISLSLEDENHWLLERLNDLVKVPKGLLVWVSPYDMRLLWSYSLDALRTCIMGLFIFRVKECSEGFLLRVSSDLECLSLGERGRC